MKVLVAVAVLLFASVMVIGQTKSTVPSPVVQPRYEIVMNPNVRADTFLLDTQTGKIWRQANSGMGSAGPDLWQFEDRIDDQDALDRWIVQKKAEMVSSGHKP